MSGMLIQELVDHAMKRTTETLADVARELADKFERGEYPPEITPADALRTFANAATAYLPREKKEGAA